MKREIRPSQPRSVTTAARKTATYQPEPLLAQSKLFRLRGIPIEAIIARWYLLLLPLRMTGPFAWVHGVISWPAVYFDFILHVLGLFLLLSRRRENRVKTILSPATSLDRRLFGELLTTITILNIVSIIMAFVIQANFGNHGSESALDGVVGNLAYFTQYLLIIFYNWKAFALITVSEIHAILTILSAMLLGLGSLQLTAILLPGTSAALDNFDRLGLLPWSFSRVSELGRISLTGPEPATAGLFLGLLVVPLLLANITVGARLRSSMFALPVALIILLFTRSTTGYLLVITDFLVWFMILSRRPRERPAYSRFSAVAALTVVLIAVFAMVAHFPVLMNDVTYALLEKPLDAENQSTISRMVLLPINLEIFLRFPLLGVGNGNQGYFYAEYFPLWASNSPIASELLQRSTETIFSGSLFTLSLFSGYGLIGVLAVCYYVFRSSIVVRDKRERLGPFYYMYAMSGVAFLVGGLQGDYVGNYLAWLPISIPFMATKMHDSWEWPQA